MDYTPLSKTIIEMIYFLKLDGYYESFTGECKNRFTVPEGTAFGLNYSCAKCRDGRKQISEILDGRCPLCNLTLPTLPLPLTKVLWVDWSRRFRIIPNAFPYFENHVNFITANHESQDIIREPNVISDIFSFYKDIGKNRWMLFFNHLIGNSLDHFHIHATVIFCEITVFEKFKVNIRVNIHLYLL